MWDMGKEAELFFLYVCVPAQVLRKVALHWCRLAAARAHQHGAVDVGRYNQNAEQDWAYDGPF